jgi:hypothetical protein
MWYRIDAPPNALRVSRRLEGTTCIDQERIFVLLDAKIALIQPVGCTRLLDRALVTTLNLRSPYFKQDFAQ